MSARISLSSTPINSGFIQVIKAVKNRSSPIIRAAIEAIKMAKRAEDLTLNLSGVIEKRQSKAISRLVEEVLRIDGGKESEMPSIIWENGFLSAKDYVLSQLEQQLWNQARVELDKELRCFDALILESSKSEQTLSKDIVGSQESPGPMAREITDYLDKREAQLRETERTLKDQKAGDGVNQLSNVILQLEGLKKARNDFEQFLAIVRSNKEMMLFDRNPAKRQEQYHRFANQLFSVFNALKERSEEEYFFSQIPNLLQVCYTAWHENINQMRQLAGLEKQLDNPICRANLAVRDLRRELLLKYALPLALQYVGIDLSLSNDVHYQLACKRILNDKYRLGYSLEELGDHEEPIVEVIQSTLLTSAKQVFDKKYRLAKVRERLQDCYKGLSDDQKEILFAPFLDYYKERFLCSRAPVLDEFSKLDELYKELERCNQIDDPTDRQRELKLLALEFQKHDLVAPFSTQTPLDLLRQELDSFNTRSSYLGCYTACKLALNSSKSCQEAVQKIRDILSREKIKHGITMDLAPSNDEGKAEASEEEGTSKQGIAREIQQVEEILQKAIDREKPEQVKASIIEQKQWIQDRLASLKEVKANLNAKLILKHTVTNDKELSNWGVCLLGNLAGVLKPAAVDGETDKILHELLELANECNPIRAELIAAVKKDGMALFHASEALRNDPVIVKLAVQQNGLALQYASKDLQNDPEVVKMAVQQNIYALHYAGEAPKNDPETVKLAVQKNGAALCDASDKLKNDPEIVKLAVQQNWQALSYAGDMPKNDPEIAKIAVRQNGQALSYAGDTPKNDPEIVKLAIQQDGIALKWASDTLKNDPEIVRLAVQQNWQALQYAGDILKNNLELVNFAVQQNWQALKYAGDILKNNLELVNFAVQQNWQALKYAGDMPKNDPELVKLAVQQNAIALAHVGKIFKNNPDLVKFLVQQNGWALCHASDTLKNDPDIVKLAVQQSGYALQFASDKLKNDPDIVKLAIQQDGLALKHASDTLKNAPEIVRLAVQQNGSALYYASDLLKNDPEIVKLAIKQNGRILLYASDKLKNDPEIVKLAVKQDPQAIAYADPALRNDPEILAVMRNE